jgi:hypothetical protein
VFPVWLINGFVLLSRQFSKGDADKFSHLQIKSSEREALRGIDHKSVGLMVGLLEVTMLPERCVKQGRRGEGRKSIRPQEGEQFWRWTIIGKVAGLQFKRCQHLLKEPESDALPLAGLKDIEVQEAGDLLFLNDTSIFPLSE